MPFYKVRATQSLGISGHPYFAGDVIELSRAMAAELSSKVDPCGPNGEAITAAEHELQGIADHERDDVLRRRREQIETELKVIDKELGSSKLK